MRKTILSGTKSLLGLGLKYCLKKAHPNNDLTKTIDRFWTNVRRISHFYYNEQINESDAITYIPGLYLKGDWDPPTPTKEIKKSI